MNPTVLAERATLGTLLADPRQLHAVAGWLRPSDFAHWWHTEVYRALLTDPGLAARGDPVATAEHVRGALVDALGHPRSDPPGLHTLMQTAPARPVAARYGAMVVEASIRRQVAGLAVHLLAAAIPDPAVPPPARRRRTDRGATPEDDAIGAPRSVQEVTGLVEPILTDLGAQWAAALNAESDPAGEHRPPCRADAVNGDALEGLVDVAADERRADRHRELAVVADRAVRSAPARAAAEVRADTGRLVAALVTRPDRIDTVAAWLRPEEVARPARAVYEALLTLRQERVSIDPVTVTWEVHRASRVRGPGPDPALLLRQDQAAELFDVDALTGTVAHDTLRRTAATTADGLCAAAGNPGLTVGDVLDAAAWAAQAVTRAARDLGAARDTATTPVGARPGPTRNPAAPSAVEADQPMRPIGGRWGHSRHLSPVAGGPDLSVLR